MGTGVRHVAHADIPRRARTAPASRRQVMYGSSKSWRCARHASAVCGGREAWGHGPRRRPWDDPEMDDEGLGTGLGVRRPLRFLAHKLELDERQVTELARILNELKTERAQGEVDRRRTLAAFADAVAGEQFDAAKAAEGGGLRVQSAERLRDA